MMGSDLINRTVIYDQDYQNKYQCISNVLKKSLGKGVSKEAAEKTGLGTYISEKLTRVHLTRYPMEGDKFISRSAQKSTIGEERKECDLPVWSNGIVPTFIMAVHPIFKRETYGQLQEAVMNRWLVDNEEYTMCTGIDESIAQF